jgi:glycosyltransferase involved in cell wall biosynthesis
MSLASINESLDLSNIDDELQVKTMKEGSSIRGQLVQAIFYNNPDQYPPIINSTRLLTQAGLGVEILCRDNGETWNISYPAEVQVRRIDTRSNSSWREYVGFLIGVLRAGNDKTMAFVGHDAHGLLPAWLLARRFRRPLIYHCHDYIDNHSSLNTIGLRLIAQFQRRFARMADLVIVPDAERGNVISSELRLKRPPMIVANAPLNRALVSGEALRNALASHGRYYKRILFRQGRIGVGHAIETTIRSIPHWSSPQWGFVVMGLSDSSYIDRLHRLAVSLGVKDQFVILPPVGYDQVAQFTFGADLGHALYEPIHINNVHITTASNKIMEYMEAGLPLMVSDTPSLRRLVDNYRCGVTADERSPEGIAAAVNTLLANPDKARQMGAAARQAFEKELCYERQFAPVIEALRNLSLHRSRNN